MIISQSALTANVLQARTPSSNRNHQQSIEERHSPDSANIEPSGDLSDDSSIDLASLKNVNGVVSDERISQAQGSTRGLLIPENFFCY